MALRSVSSMIADAAVENYTKKQKILSHCSFIPLKITNFAYQKVILKDDKAI